MQIKDDFIHIVPFTVENRLFHGDGTKRDHAIYKGTSEQVAQQVADAIKRALDDGRTTQIVLTPVAPWSIIDLKDRA